MIEVGSLRLSPCLTVLALESRPEDGFRAKALTTCRQHAHTGSTQPQQCHDIRFLCLFFYRQIHEPYPVDQEQSRCRKQISVSIGTE